jgi:hypothetical protein
MITSPLIIDDEKLPTVLVDENTRAPSSVPVVHDTLLPGLFMLPSSLSSLPPQLHDLIHEIGLRHEQIIFVAQTGSFAYNLNYERY